MSERRRIYVAGRTCDQGRVQGVQDVIRALGGTITFDWTGAEGEVKASGEGTWDDNPEKGARIAEREIQACRSADVCVLLMTDGNGRGGLGCFIEAGATLAAGGELWVVTPTRDSVFWQHPACKRFDSIAELTWAIQDLLSPQEPAQEGEADHA